MGFTEYLAAGKARQTPHMLGFEAAGAAPIVRNQVIPNPETVATAIRIGSPTVTTAIPIGSPTLSEPRL